MVWLPLTTSGLETERVYSQRKRQVRQVTKIQCQSIEGAQSAGNLKLHKVTHKPHPVWIYQWTPEGREAAPIYVGSLLWTTKPPLPSNRHHRSNGDCLEGKTENYQICSVQYSVQQLCTVQCTHTWTDLTVLWIGFCLTGPISLCLDSFLYIYHVYHCILHACAGL